MVAGSATIIRPVLALMVLGGILVGIRHQDGLAQHIMDEWQLNPHTAVRDADYDLSKLLASMEKRVMIGTFGTDASQLEHDLDVLRYQLALTQTDAYRVRFEDIPQALNVLDETSRDIEQLYPEIIALRPGDVDAFAALQEQLLGHRDALTELVDHSKDWSQNRLANLKRERNQWTMLQYGLLAVAGLLSLSGAGLFRRRKKADMRAVIDDTIIPDVPVEMVQPMPSGAEDDAPVVKQGRKSLFAAPRMPNLALPMQAVPEATASRSERAAPVPTPVAMPMDVPGMVDDLVQMVAPWAAHQQISLACTLDPDIPRQIAAFAPEVKQVFRHLAGNAIKYTRQGGIVLAADLTSPLSHADSSVRFSVLDTGIGIEPGYRDLIFGQQVQVDPDQAVDFSAFDPAQQGLGNGLAIVRQLVSSWGGQVGVESKPGLGSKFWFTVPALDADACIGASIDARHHQILVVDSDLVRSEAIADQCQAFGADVMIAEHGFAAIEAITLLQREATPQHAGLYDLMLIAAPHGVQPLLPLLRQIARLEHAPRRIALAVPQVTQVADAAWAEELGADIHLLPLPVPGGALVDLIRQVARNRQMPAMMRA